MVSGWWLVVSGEAQQLLTAAAQRWVPQSLLEVTVRIAAPGLQAVVRKNQLLTSLLTCELVGDKS